MEKETELNNVRNNFETELKRKISEAHRTIEITKSQNSDMEIRKIKQKYEQEFKAKEETQVQVYRDYQERDQEWQLEKQVNITCLENVKINKLFCSDSYYNVTTIRMVLCLHFFIFV